MKIFFSRNLFSINFLCKKGVVIEQFTFVQSLICCKLLLKSIIAVTKQKHQIRPLVLNISEH